MTELTRREAIAAVALTGIAATLPVWAQQAAADGALWDLTEIYPDVAAWDTARRDLLPEVKEYSRFKGRLGESASVLAEALVLQSDLSRVALRVYSYASLKADEDVRVSAWQERNAQVTELFSTLGEATSWVAPNCCRWARQSWTHSSPPATCCARASISIWPMCCVRLRIPSRPSRKRCWPAPPRHCPRRGKSPSSCGSSDIPWPSIRLSTGKDVRLDSQGYTLNRAAPNREDRKAVFAAFWKTYGEYRNSFGATYLAKVQGNIFAARARKYPGALAAALSSNNVPDSVYRTLVAEANKGLPVLHRYFQSAAANTRAE